jgi:DNA polymerase-3 subunit epsilon
MRHVILDTETTGLEWHQGHRIIEIGCLEVVDRRVTDNRFHKYLNPERAIDIGALEVHGISSEMLLDQPKFGDIAEDLLAFITGSELVIHNAVFDTGFLNNELSLAGAPVVEVQAVCRVQDTLQLARQLHPGQRNSLDALCKRYGVDNSRRALHGAMLDAEILADVYLLMTGGQSELSFSSVRTEPQIDSEKEDFSERNGNKLPLEIIRPSKEDLTLHQKWLEILGDDKLW